jgi:hypothetical protein
LLNWFAALAQDEGNWRQFGIFALNHQVTGEIHLTIQTVFGSEEDEATIKEEFITPLLASLNQITRYTLMTRPGLAHHGYIFQNSADTCSYTFYEAVQNLNGSGSNQRGKYKSAYMRKAIPPDQVQVIFKWLNTIPAGLGPSDMAQSLLQVDTYGGRINTIDPAETAIPQRTSILKLQYQTYWADEANDSYHLNWIRGFYTEVYQNTGGAPDPRQDSLDNVDGCYYNYPDADLNELPGKKETALRLYFGNNLERLTRVKSRWDPNNYFNSSQSI